jgi:hypothetical protein
MSRNRHMNSARSRAAIGVIAVLTLVSFAACSKAKTTTKSSPTAKASPTPTPSSTFTAGHGLSGIVTALAGNGGDDIAKNVVPGPATNLSLGDKAHFAVASNGDIFVTIGTVDVLKISGGQVTKFAELAASEQGTGGIVIGPDFEPPADPKIPDAAVFVASPSTVRKFTTDGKVKGKLVLDAKADGLPTSLQPLALDSAGNLYVGDGSPKITRIAPDGSKKVVAGVAGANSQAPSNSAPGDGGPATAAKLSSISQIAIDAKGNLLIADNNAHRIRRVATDGIITTIAGGGATKLGSGNYAPDGTKATDLELSSSVNGVAVDDKGRVYVSDGQNRAIFRFGTDGAIELVIGDQTGAAQTAGQPANKTRATNVGQLAFDTKGNLFYLDARVIRSIADAGK